MWYNTAALSVAAKSDRISTVTDFRLRKFKLFFWDVILVSSSAGNQEDLALMLH